MVNNINKIFKRTWYVEFESQKDKRFNSVQLTYSAIMMDPTAPGQKWFCRIWWGGSVSFYKEAYGKTKFAAYRNAFNQIQRNHYIKVTGNIL